MTAHAAILAVLVLNFLSVCGQQTQGWTNTPSAPAQEATDEFDQSIPSSPEPQGRPDSQNALNQLPLSAGETPWASQESMPGSAPVVLALTKINGWRHDAVVNATNLFRLYAEHRNWDLTLSSDPDEHFSTAHTLRKFDVIVFLLTIGPIFSDVHKSAFQSFVNEGGSVVGVHSALDTNNDWPFFTNLFGATFVGHPPVQRALINTVDPNHSSTFVLPPQWEIEEEFYNYGSPLHLEDKHILLTVDENSYEGGVHGAVHPVSWTKLHLPVGSRVWYTALGHTPESYSIRESSQLFQLHLAQGVEWAASGTAVARERAAEVKADLLNVS